MKRRGITLLETAIAVTLVGIALAAVAVLLTVLFRTEVQIRRDLAQQTTLARLCDRFRSDAHLATECTAEDRCRLELPNGRTIEYAWQVPRISRVVQRGDKVEHRDSFELPRGARVSFAVAAEQSKQIATLEIAAADEARNRFSTVVRPSRIEAVVRLHEQSVRPMEETP